MIATAGATERDRMAVISGRRRKQELFPSCTVPPKAGVARLAFRGRKRPKQKAAKPCRAPWKIDDFGDEVGGKKGNADYADYTDF